MFWWKLSSLKQPDFYENLSRTYRKRQVENTYDLPLGHSLFSAVVRHELKYLWSLKTLLLNFLFLTMSPAMVVCLMKSYCNAFDLNYAILITTLMMPRIPTNLIAYSIGGEKVYKTGELLLSTPVKMHTLLLAKSFVPAFVSILMISMSSLLVIAAMPLYNLLCGTHAPIPHYTFTQLLLLFSVCILSCVLMIFLTATLSLVLMTPRQGLYVTSFLGFMFLLPVSIIVYVTTHTLLWSMLYLSLLIITICVFYLFVRNKTSRLILISKL